MPTHLGEKTIRETGRRKHEEGNVRRETRPKAGRFVRWTSVIVTRGVALVYRLPGCPGEKKRSLFPAGNKIGVFPRSAAAGIISLAIYGVVEDQNKKLALRACYLRK